MPPGVTSTGDLVMTGGEAIFLLVDGLMVRSVSPAPDWSTGQFSLFVLIMGGRAKARPHFFPLIPMSVQDGTKARWILGCWRGASEAHIRSDLQRAGNEASSPEGKRISLILNGIWNYSTCKSGLRDSRPAPPGSPSRPIPFVARQARMANHRLPACQRRWSLTRFISACKARAPAPGGPVSSCA